MKLHCLGRLLNWFARYQAFAIVASCVLLADPLNAASEKPQVYTGTIGAESVVVELDGSGGDVTGRYFYRKHRLDIGLRGTWQDDRLTLKAETTGDRLTLRRTGKGLSGSLTTKATRRIPVTWSPLGANGGGPNTLRADLAGHSLYEHQQLADLALVAGDVRQDGTRSLRDWREPLSGIIHFRIESGYPPPVLEKINAALERHHWERVSQWFTCEGYGGEPGMEISESRSLYLGDDLVSYVWFANWSCAGTAHPDFGSQGYTFDAHTGRELALEDMLYFGGGPVPAADSSAWYAYRREFFAPRVVTLFGQLYPEEMRPGGGEEPQDECDYTDSSVWDFPSWHVTHEGLYLGAYFARAQRPCDEPDWSVIPWKHLTWRKPAALAANRPVLRHEILHFGELSFGPSDIEYLSQNIDDQGFPVLDIALQPDATQRLQAETFRLLNTDVTLALGTTPFVSARLVEPIAEGKLRLGGGFSLVEARDMARQIICTLHLSADQYGPPSLSNDLPCKLDKRQGAK
ncbi:MAG: hypothetical protein ACOVQ0_05315 [Novosphingobium sp.]|uniref:hypothetical protein n=1 Tax=Novosphingobium sp. TaxID=1874826 RepID=UPI003B9C0AC8